MTRPLTNAEKCHRYREKAKAHLLKSTQSIMSVLAVHRALQAPPPKGVFQSSCGLPYYVDQRGISLRWIRGYSDA